MLDFLSMRQYNNQISPSQSAKISLRHQYWHHATDQFAVAQEYRELLLSPRAHSCVLVIQNKYLYKAFIYLQYVNAPLYVLNYLFEFPNILMSAL